MKNKINVLSLFDGISCGQVALRMSNIPIENYYASEIDKHAIKVTNNNFPNTKQLGNVNSLITDGLPKIDLLMGGSPCTNFSFAGKQNGMITKDKIEITSLEQYIDLKSKGYEFEGQSYLFWEYIRILREVKPKYFLLENVVMKKEYQDVISECLGVEPVKLNSKLTSAQNRVRLYWANFPITEPKDKEINLSDIIDNSYSNPAAIRGRRLNKATILGRRINEKGKREDYNKKIPITQCLEVRASNRNKSNCLTTVAKDTVLTPMDIGRHVGAYENNLPYRNYTKVERCRLMNLPDNYCDVISMNQTVKATGNGWEVGMISHIFDCLKKFDSNEVHGE